MLRRLVSILRPRRVPPFELPPEETLDETPSGLRYRIVAPGSGPAPGPEDTVTVRYAGWLTDGRLFDASWPHTASFPLNRVIAGWTEGLQLLGAGGTAILVIPPELAYGQRGARPLIGPGETLVFRVELVRVGG